MDIRSITLFIPPDFAPSQASAFLANARHAFPFPVQSLRLATPPFPDWWDTNQSPSEFAARWQVVGFDYLCLGPVLLHHDDHWLNLLPDIIGANDILFASAEIANLNGSINPQRCFQISHIIDQTSRKMSNGFGNLYFTAIANCPPGSPFYPVAYHDDGPASFAIAVESADLARRAISSAHSLAEARQNLIHAIETAANKISTAAASLAEKHNLAYRGIDFSLAPYPTSDKSLAGALEDLGLSTLGTPGSLFAAALVTEAIAQANFPRCGFSGLMMPVLEDNILAQRAASGHVTISDLLNYSAVCGVGLDTIPLPGDTNPNLLAGILLDVAALATRLNKPLTARLMPLPGLQAGDKATFNFPYFADGRVMPVIGTGPTPNGHIATSSKLKLKRYH
ncbi:MAG TPA: DUF711 family protein [Anaerolineae bacterium]|nr:DUF711 family protein [Anaerolineae bacterium]